MATLERAIEIAAEAHSGQFDKGGEPYILHSLRVMLRVRSDEERIVAVLHDVVEDSSHSLETLLQEGFSPAIIEAVKALTKLPGESRTAAAHRAAANPIARVVKLADNTENMDLSRIPNLTEKDFARLKEYEEVRAILAASSAVQAPAPVLLKKALEATCASLPGELLLVPLDHWTESVLRFLLVRNIRTIAPGATVWTEWNRVDLILPESRGATIVELKFFGHQALRGLDGRVLRMKGGPSRKNEGEFKSALKRLTEAATKAWASKCAGIAAAFLVLIYCDPKEADIKTYGSYYDGLQPDGDVTAIQVIAERKHLFADVQFTCKLLEIRVDDSA